MNIFHSLLFAAIATGVMQASLDKAGVGRVESLPASAVSNILVILSIPVTFLSNLGLIVIVVWSFFVLPLLPTLVVVVASFIGFSLIWGTALAYIRRSEVWYTILSVGTPIVLLLRLTCTSCIIFLATSYAQGNAG